MLPALPPYPDGPADIFPLLYMLDPASSLVRGVRTGVAPEER